MENVKMNIEDKLNLLKRNLIEELNNTDKLFIMPHINMDFDSIASAAALHDICASYRKTIYIVTDDNESTMESSFSIMYKELKKTCDFISTSEVEKLRSDDDLLVIVDTNKTNLVPMDVSCFKHIIIIDHHKTDEKTIYTDKMFIETDISSASEIMFNLIKKFNININEYLAHCLLAGIYLDTNRLSRNFKSSTSRAVTELMDLGANSDEVNNLFVIANFDNDRMQQRLISKLIDSTLFSMYNIAISINDTYSYTQENLAKAADYLLQYSIDAAFVIGFVDKKELGLGHKDLVSVKARSKSKKENTIDVSNVMKIFGGGGDENRAACLIETDNILAVKEAIQYIIKPGVSLLENTEGTEKVFSLMPKDKL